MLPFLVGEYQGVELRGHRLILCLTIGTAGLPEKEAILRMKDRKQEWAFRVGAVLCLGVAGDPFISVSAGTSGTFHG